MRPFLALSAIFFAMVIGSVALAQDSTPTPARGLFDRFRKPKEVVPPSPPRQLPAATTTPPTPAPVPRSVTPTPTERPRFGAGSPSTAMRAIPTGKPTATNSPALLTDAPLRKVQATPTDMGAAIVPGAALPAPESGQSLSLQQALTGALTSNPDLITLRTGNAATASAEAVEVARHFPTTLNPTAFIDYRPITLIPRGTFGTGSPAGSGSNTGSFYHHGQGYILVAIRQPVEFGHQTTHRHSIAKAAYSQVQWQIVQAELTALVQTYRFFQTAAYRREKLRVAEQLAGFNEELLSTLDRRLKSGLGLAADVALARVESRATRQQARAARQDYVTALTDLRNQIGIPETAAETEPLGEFALPGNIPPLDEQALIQAALQCRPDLHAAQAGIEAAAAAVRLAKGDRIPTTIIGPQYVQDEAGLQYVGFNLVPTIPLLNNGKPLVRQREAEQRRATIAYQQAQQRAVAQVRAAVVKWNGATGLVGDSSGLTRELTEDVASLDRLFQQGQTDLTKVQQARARLIQLENAQLDALWAATQAQADLMSALGVPSLIHALLQAAEADAGVAPAAPAVDTAMPPMAPTPSPFTPVPR